MVLETRKKYHKYLLQKLQFNGVSLQQYLHTRVFYYNLQYKGVCSFFSEKSHQHQFEQ